MGFSLLLNLVSLILFPVISGAILMQLASRPDVAPRWVINSGRILIWTWFLLAITTFLPLNYEGPIARAFQVPRAADWGLMVLGLLILLAGVLWGIGRFIAERLRLGEVIGPECWDPEIAVQAGGTWREAEHLRRSLEAQYQADTKLPDLGVRYSKVAHLPFTVRNRIFAPLWVATSQLRGYVEVLLHHEREHIMLGHHKLAWRYGRLAKIFPPLGPLFAPMKLAMEAEADRRALSKLQETSPKDASKYIEALRAVVDGAFEEEQKLELGHDAGNVPARIQQATTPQRAPRLAMVGLALLSLTLGCMRVMSGPIDLGEALGFTVQAPPTTYNYRFWTAEASVKPILGEGGMFLDGVETRTEEAPRNTLALSVMPAITRRTKWVFNPSAPAVRVSFDYEAYPVHGYSGPPPTVELSGEESTSRSNREQEIRAIDFRFIDLKAGKGRLETYVLDQDEKILGPKENSTVFTSMYLRIPAGWRFRLTNLEIKRGAGPKSLRTGSVDADIAACVAWKKQISMHEPPPNLSWRRTNLGE